MIKDRIGECIGLFSLATRMAIVRVFLGTPVLPLMGRGLNLINEFGTGMRFFFKPGAGLGIVPSCFVPSRLHIKLILIQRA